MLDSFHSLLIVFWVLYACLHSMMATAWFKRYMQLILGRHFSYYRLLYSCVAASTLVLLLVFQFSNSSTLLFRPKWPLFIVGPLLSLGGLCLMMICIRKYFVNLSGVEVLLKQKRAPVLEKDGLHGYVRHPLYSATLLFIWSLFLIFPLLNNFIACLIITVYTLIGIRIEERKLVTEFGDDYKMYAGKTPMLVPSFRKKSQDKRGIANHST